MRLGAFRYGAQARRRCYPSRGKTKQKSIFDEIFKNISTFDWIFKKNTILRKFLN
jgi:hypothetical protein